jgi:site-specific DNA-methyltransferase (adenine-specific)
MNTTLIHGDCLQEMAKLPEGSIDLVLTDPPYGTTMCKWDTVIPFEPMWEQLKRVTKKNKAIVMMATQPFTAALVMSNPKWFKHEWVWHKSKSGSAFTAKYRPLARHESVLVFGKGKVTYNPIKRDGTPYKRARISLGDKINNHGIGFNGKGIFSENDGFRYPESVIFFQQKWRRQDQVHPTQKPVALMEYLIKTYTNEGDTILDFTMGSGTTGVACKNTNRNFIGIELNKGYFEIASKRIAIVNDNEPFCLK